MTREEALKIVRENYPHFGTTEPWLDLEKALATLIPELAESEDERTRKWIVNLLHELHYNETAQPIALKAIEWLEKQKEQPTDAKSERVIKAARRVLENWIYGDVNADVSGDLTELEYAFKDYDGEEKQKENAKSADSIPSDCTADAKCENSWHKVADSLPDNPKEVLCKDEAGNFFIGRYYVGEGWEISNYDDEDKPHDLNPPVSKWIDFPSEKQKEQSIPLMNGDADLYFDNWIQHNDTTKRGCFVEGMRYAERLLSEHTPLVKKEDYSGMDDVERAIHRGFLAAQVHNVSRVIIEETAKEVRGILKKEQKPAEWSEEDERIVNNIVSVLGQYIDYKSVSGTGSGYATPRYTKEIDWLKSLRRQPKQELSEDVKKTLDEVSHILVGLNYKQIAKDYKQAIEKLLYSRPSWKPSEEQMDALCYALQVMNTDLSPIAAKTYQGLQEIHRNLKKLM